MLEQLRQVRRRYQEVELSLRDPAVLADNARCASLMREYRRLTPLMEAAEKGHSSAFLGRWLSLAEPALLRVREQLAGAPQELQQRACEETSILLSMENLMTFPWIRQRVEAGSLKIHGWYFHMDSGEMYDYDSEREEFLPLSESGEPF